MKKIITLKFISILILISTSWSQSNNMKVNLKDGTSVLFPIKEIKKITFKGLPTDIGSKSNFSNIIDNLILFQNYPNPFNPTTTIQYKIPKPGLAQIRIFNLAGQLVKSYRHDVNRSGIYKILWNGKNEHGNLVSSGLYIYQVKFDNLIIAKRMIFMK